MIKCCGFEFPDALGKYGCPNCNGEREAAHCDLCERGAELHEDAIGFHHVLNGERAACPHS